MSVNVGAYVRISLDKSGREVGVRDQERMCRELAERRGWAITKVYAENDTSAYKRRKVTLPDGRKALRVIRPVFRQMLDDLEARKIDGAIVYDLDRMARDPRDLEDLIDVKQMHGIRLDSVTGSLNLDTDSGIAMSRVMVTMASKSSADTSRRVARAALRRAEAGEFHGGRLPYGYRMNDGNLVPDPEHVALIGEAADRLLSGDSLYGIVDDWNRRGVRTGTDNQWRSRTLRRILLAPATIGQTTAGVQGWEPVLDATKRERLEVLLTNPARKFNTPDGKYEGKRSMGGGLTVCALCGQSLYSHVMQGQVRLVCSKARGHGCGKVTIMHDPLEQYVWERVLTRLRRSERLAQRMAEPAEGNETETAALEQQRRDLDDQEARAYQAYVEDGAPKHLWLAQSARVRTERDKVEAQLNRLYEAAGRPAITGDVDWRAWSPLQRRTALRRLVAHVEVSPWPAGLATTVTARRGESPESLAERRRELTLEGLRIRVKIVPR